MITTFRYAATCPKGVEPLLAAELRALGVAEVRETRAAVTFTGPVEAGYRACLWSRLAARVLINLAEFPAATADELYAGVAALPWEEHLAADGTLAIDVVGATSGLTHTRFTAQKAKDAIVDRLRERTGNRPSVEFERPDLRVNLRLARERAILSIDLSGEPLHERGYRTPGEQAEAPLKENLAAAVLVRAGWPEVAAAGGALVDPMCGSGTLLVEGALMAADQAPGLLREYWGFTGWLGHDADAWHGLLDEADDRAEAGRDRLPVIAGFDEDASAIALALACAKRAGFGAAITVEQRELRSLRAPAGARPGLLVTNPPYGVRLGESEALVPLYATLGERLLAEFDGWQAAILTSDESLARATGLRSSVAHTLYNGTIEVKLYRFEVARTQVRAEVRRAPDARSAGAQILENRLRKNVRHLGKWARREGVTCYRVYDADLPEYAVAIDLYEGAGPDAGRRLAHLAEYAPPPEIDAAMAEARLAEAIEVASAVLEVAPADVAVKVRRRQRGTSQYEKLAERGEFVEVAEGGLRFQVNLHDYLDTGLFLDHRPARAMLRELAAGKRVCNLFAYTGAASVYAAAGGASAVHTVDLSETYVEWARRNMALNGYAEATGVRFFATDALRWLAEERRRVEGGLAEPYGVVFCDPPTYSSSKKMTQGTFDVQRDHVPLVTDAAALLADDGVLVFSTNLRTFKLDSASLADLAIEDVTPATIPPDFARTPRVHQCFLVRQR
ncbi:MAG: bifunctional 23S rRNA (guanine(2069)-N(7))-methyltransferase RlmK/23S rRNA (guanine(2445)-N(2))-methyltransferase RlmL [Coriobacteriia bacterium]|nr:bifunctional 23S rRNA (guanine(2069)-N(7))-methyltransferase RlmK/23S rRNA (guanine(2445)-N(2))-methyltransferase RlmL [Coriobacteriia bacterium]